MTYPFKGGWYATPAIDFHLVDSNELDVKKSSVFGFGAAFGKQLGASIDARLGGKVYTGNADGGNLDVSGYQLTLGLTATL